MNYAELADQDKLLSVENQKFNYEDSLSTLYCDFCKISEYDTALYDENNKIICWKCLRKGELNER